MSLPLTDDMTMMRSTALPPGGQETGEMIMTTRFKTFASCLATVVAACGVAPSASHAAISYQYMTDVTALSLLPGQTGSVNLYLVETVTDGTTSRLATEDGLSSAYVGVTYTPPATPLASPTTIFSVAANVGDFNDIAGPDQFVAGDHASGFIREYVDIAQPTGPAGVLLSPGVRQVFLGSVVVLGGSSGGTTTFTVADDPITNDTVTIDGYATPIDAGSITPASFDVTVLVPEPASVVTGGVMVLYAITLRRHRSGR
jgi:hypothetical protein